MEKNNMNEEIFGLLEVIIEQAEEISNHKGRIPQIEIDIVLSNIRDLYDIYKSLERMNKTQAIKPDHEKEERPEPEKPVIPVINEIVVEEKETVTGEHPVIEKEIISEEPLLTKEEISHTFLLEEDNNKEELKNNIVEEISDEEIPQYTKKSKTKKTGIDLFSTHTTVADKFRDEKKSLNEKLSSSHTDNSIASKLQKNPIKDIRTAIGINEKFKFINELFEGNLQKYNKSIATLNGFGGFEDANTHLSLLKEEFSWAEDNEAYHELNDLVIRRYQ